MRKIVIASDSFKGTLASSEICNIAERVIPEYFPECDVFAVPVADGGEGTVECFNALSMTFGSGFNFGAGIDYYFGPCTLFKRGIE